MILIEQDAKPLLMERLDECLKVHADMLDAQNIGSIYELQGLSELHYYLKVEHVFTPAEVEALLSFQDPLDVARWFHKRTFRTGQIYAPDETAGTELLCLQGKPYVKR